MTMDTSKEEEMLIDDIHFSGLRINVVNEKKRTHSESSTSDSSEKANKLRRSQRKRIRPLLNAEANKVLTRAKKLDISSDNMKEITKYYLDKKVKSTTPTLETIFEEPLDNLVMSNKKLKRYIQFPPQCNRSKVLKRRKKSKTLKSTFRKSAKKAGTDLLLQSKLIELENL